MPSDLYERMLMERLHGTQRWENEPADGWSVDDLDAGEIHNTLNEAIRRGRLDDPGTRDVPAILRGLGLIRGGVLLRAAVVLFGREERLPAEYPQFLVRLAKFRGVDKTEFLDNRQFHGHAFRLLSLAERFCREHLPVAGRIVPDLFERVDDPLYPPLALREALANAICRRDYSLGGGGVSVGIYADRLEITSAGELHFGLTVADLLREHDSQPWNPIVAGVFHKRGVIDTWGRGTLKMVELAERAGLPAPEYETPARSFVVRFRPGSYLPPQVVNLDLTDRQRAVLQVVGRSGPIATRELVGKLRVRHRRGDHAQRTVQNETRLLRDLRLIEFTGRGPNVRWSLRDDRGERSPHPVTP